MPNAANCAAVADAVARAGLEVTDVTRQTAIIAVQGPASDALVAPLGVPGPGLHVVPPPPRGSRGREHGLPDGLHRGTGRGDPGPGRCGRGGLGRGHCRGRRALRAGARDTLRTEMGYPLHGHELSPSVPARWSPVGWAVVADKGPFNGRDAYVVTPAEQKIVGLRMVERGSRAHR